MQNRDEHGEGRMVEEMPGLGRKPREQRRGAEKMESAG
jgi:hypothetical protein